MARKRNIYSQANSLFKTEVPKMPEGYYSGDKPNRNLYSFVQEHQAAKPNTQDADDYDRAAPKEPTYGRKNTSVYNMHLYWSKKPHEAIDFYIRHFTESGDLILDPMCGSGSTVFSSVMSQRKAIGIDLSPAATFMTAQYCTPINIEEIESKFRCFIETVEQQVLSFYKTTCSRCGGDAITESTDYSAIYRCDRCLNDVPLVYCKDIDGKRYCPHCYANGNIEEISTRKADYVGEQPFRVSYRCITGCKNKRYKRELDDQDFIKYDLARLSRNESIQLPYSVPESRLPLKADSYRLKKVEARTVKDLFSPTNLAVLSILFHYAESDFIRFILSSAVFMASRMVRESNTQILPGRYYIPPLRRELNVLNTVQRKYKNFLKLQKVLQNANGRFMTSTQDASDLSNIPTNSIDYIFTDPPYGDKFQYYELNYLWEAWLGFSSDWADREMIINRSRALSEKRWQTILKNILSECYRVLKPGRWLTLCYHDTAEGTWELVQDTLVEIGFIPDRVGAATYIETNQKSFKQYTADIVNKRDLVINFRKPKPGEVSFAIVITDEEDKTTFNEKVRQIIRDYLDANPGSTKDRIFDEVVSRMVRSGRMEAHDFDELLDQVAEEVRQPVKKNLFENESPNIFGTHEVCRWYLKETELAISDAAESAKEDAAAEKISAFIKKHLEKHPGEEGVHYSDLFEHFVYTVKDKPRRPLAEWLLDYFYKTELGTYRLPISEEEERAKAEGRAKGTNRRVKRYLAWLEQEVAIPEKERPNDATLAEWIRHCKRSGLYEQGKFLYEKGGLNLDNLPEEAMVNVEEDYQVCVRMLARNANTDSGKKTKRGRRRKTK